jgi:hypothetical protein
MKIKINYFKAIKDLELKIKKCRMQRELLLSDFVENFNLDNLNDVDKYDKALKILRTSEKILQIRVEQLKILKKRSENEQ